MRQFGDLLWSLEEEGEEAPAAAAAVAAGDAAALGDDDEFDYGDDAEPPRPRRRVPHGDIYEASRAGDADRVRRLVEEEGVDINVRDRWDSVPLYYTCLAGHLDAARILLDAGAICSEHTFDGDRCHYSALNLRIRRILKAYEARPPPLDPLAASLRDCCIDSNSWWADITLCVAGKPIRAHRALLSARSSFLAHKLQTSWRGKSEIRFANLKLTYAALHALIQFFYTDRLEIAVDDLEDLARVCKVCRCKSLQEALEKEIVHQKYANHKSLHLDDRSQRRHIFQAISLPEDSRLPAALRNLLARTAVYSALAGPMHSANRRLETHNIHTHTQRMSDAHQTASLMNGDSNAFAADVEDCQQSGKTLQREVADNGHLQLADDHADVCFLVDQRLLRSHRFILASRSEYFRALFARTEDFQEGLALPQGTTLEGSAAVAGYLPVRPVHDLSINALEKLLEYIYTDKIEEIQPSQAEEVFEAASRYLLFSLKRATADALIPQLETASISEICSWLEIADLYGVWKLREYCLDTVAANFESFAVSREFRRLLRRLPPPSGDSEKRTSAPSAPGGEVGSEQANVLDDLREKWLEIEGAELEERDVSAAHFDKRLELLALQSSSIDELESIEVKRGSDDKEDVLHRETRP
eukprot:SM000249S08256  [mRNA]  locus=s249:67047:70521:- [translate_table: standard]